MPKVTRSATRTVPQERCEQPRPELELARTAGYLSARVGQAFQRSLVSTLRAAGYSITVEMWR